MSERTRKDPETPHFGNTIDGSRPGDGSGSRFGNVPDAHTPGAGINDDMRERLIRDKLSYRTPDKKWDRAVGGSSGTTDGA